MHEKPTSPTYPQEDPAALNALRQRIIAQVHAFYAEGRVDVEKDLLDVAMAVVQDPHATQEKLEQTLDALVQASQSGMDRSGGL